MKRILPIVLILLTAGSFSLAQETGRVDPPMQFGDPGMGQQRFPPQGGPEIIVRTNPEIRRQLEEIKIWQMTKEMNLPTDKSEKFFPLYNKYTDEMREITSARQLGVRKLDSMVTDHAADSEVKHQINVVAGLDSRLADIHMKFIESLGKILSPTEVAKYIVFEQRFDREIRSRIRMLMQQRMRGPR